MPTSQAQVTTAMASRYLQQLCKHFAHKLPASHDALQGRIEFALGTCTLAAAGDRLTLRAQAADEPDLAQLEQIVARHLERFAFRDQPEVVWVREAADRGHAPGPAV
jgi:hypothetical protein